MTEGRRIATVTQINNYIKALMEQVPVLQNVWIKGEISNLKFHSSGHIYLTLKDGGAVLKAVMFRGAAQNLQFKPADGNKVLARGRISVYEAGGQYQLYIEEMEAEGMGDLYAKFEELKKKLYEEGLFDEDKKKPIPDFPETIGIVTSPTGAAIRDMINVIQRRYPVVKIIVYPCLVQGESASQSIVDGINYFNTVNPVDLIITGRGGGSIEDLWAFNEENTARAVFASAIPVISAVGHEVDFTICDFVADLRAPTPSAAAELAVPDILELRRNIDSAKARISVLLKNKVNNASRQLELLSQRTSYKKIEKFLIDKSQTVDVFLERCVVSYKNKTDLFSKSFAALCGKLSALSPIAVFERGYCSASKNGKLVSKIEEIEVGDTLNMRLSDGEAECSVVTRRKFE